MNIPLNDTKLAMKKPLTVFYTKGMPHRDIMALFINLVVKLPSFVSIRTEIQCSPKLHFAGERVIFCLFEMYYKTVRIIK